MLNLSFVKITGSSDLTGKTFWKDRRLIPVGVEGYEKI